MLLTPVCTVGLAQYLEAAISYFNKMLETVCANLRYGCTRHGMECGQLGQAKFSLLEFVIFKIN